MVLRYDRGDIVGTPVDFDAWVAALTARWRREVSVARVFEAGAPFTVCAHGPEQPNRVDVDVGAPAFTRSDGMIAQVTLPRDAMAKLADAMKAKGESFVLEELDQVKWTFADR